MTAPMTAPTRYVAQTYVAAELEPAAGLTALQRLTEQPDLEVQPQLWLCDSTGAPTSDITGTVQDPGSAEVAYDSPAEVSGTLQITLNRPLRWGADLVRPYLMLRSRSYPAVRANGVPTPAGSWWRYPLGLYVVTSPGITSTDTDSSKWAVTGYDRCYLLQNEPQTSFTWATGTRYQVIVQDLMRAAGALGAAATLDTICTYSADWYAKTLPRSKTVPLGDGSSFLQLINGVLAESGCAELYMVPSGSASGRFAIDLVTDPKVQAWRWAWQGSSAVTTQQAAQFAAANYPQRRVLLKARQSYNGDVHNQPNRWIFVRSGLSFKPVEGSGRYTVNNTSTPPADQGTVGRVIASVQILDAATQADLVVQGDKIVRAALSNTEKVGLATTPWPVAGNYDVFGYLHAALPYGAVRRLQAQRWRLPLAGGAMDWETNAVSTS